MGCGTRIPVLKFGDPAAAEGGTMPSDEEQSNQVGSTTKPVADGTAGERVYDSFIVRLWREVGNPRLLRVEVEHAQSGDVTSARGVAVDWIGPRVGGLLRESPLSLDRTGGG